MRANYLPVDSPLPQNDMVEQGKFDFAGLGNILIPPSFFAAVSNIACLDDAEKALDWMEKQVSLLKLKQQQVREIRNRHLPISKLPGDVLSMIFGCLCSSIFPDVPLWLSFSQVCRSWRYLALDDQQLWTSIPLRLPRLAKEFITRAGQCPIELDAGLGHMPPGMLTDELQHLGILDLAFRRDKNFRVLAFHDLSRHLMDQHFPDASFSTLESLRLASTAQDPGEVHSFPDMICPQLRRIDISNFIFPLKMQPLQHLTHLHILSYHHRTVTTISVPMILRLIATAPNLTHVELVHALRAPHPSDRALTDSPTFMSNLVALKVIDDTKLTAMLLSGIRLPIPSLDHHCDSRRPWPILRKMRLVQDIHPQQSYFNLKLGNRFTDLVRPSFQEDGWGEDGKHLLIELGGEGHPDTTSQGTFLSQIAGYIPFTDIVELNARDVHTWDLISTLPALTTITLGVSAEGFIHWLHEYLKRPPSHARVFPRLATIGVQSINLWDDCSGAGDMNLFDFLEDLGGLKQRGTPLDNFVVSDCEDLEDYIDDVRESLAVHQISLICG